MESIIQYIMGGSKCNCLHTVPAFVTSIRNSEMLFYADDNVAGRRKGD